jgi:O-antigen ligase
MVNILSIGNYFMHKETIDALLLESKSIPVFGGMHHIHFGIINALSILALVYHYWQKVFSKNYLKMAWVLGLVIFISFHILSSRTGLVSFYVAIVFSTVMHFSLNTNWRWSLASVLLILIAPIGFYFLSTSLQNKVTNTLEDVKTWNSPNREDINHQSMAMRIEAYKAALYTIRNNGFFGVGADRMEQEIFESFKKINTPLTFENQKMPHNQLLESTVKYGIFGVLGFLFFFILPLIGMNMKPGFVFVFGVILCLFISSMFESLLERQVSVFVFVYFILYAFSFSGRVE